MLTHSQIWDAIDALAKRHGISTSNLAKRAGLDPTTFNRSKRISADGHPRWPSTESIAKALAATGATVDEFLNIVPRSERSPRRIPFRILGDAFGESIDSTGKPVDGKWEEINFPDLPDEAVFAVEIRGNNYAPVFRDGAILVVSPSAHARRGDRVLFIDHEQGVHVALLDSQSATHVHFLTLNGQTLQPCPRADIKMIARILWASQ